MTINDNNSEGDLLLDASKRILSMRDHALPRKTNFHNINFAVDPVIRKRSFFLPEIGLIGHFRISFFAQPTYIRFLEMNKTDNTGDL